MRTAQEVSSAKLRGGFYTPSLLVDHTLGQLRRLLPSGDGLRVLEPGVGDGAFIAGLKRGGFTVQHLLGLDVDEAAVGASRATASALGIPGLILHRSTLGWSLESTEKFDAVVGNLPFVRFQFVPPEDKVAADNIAIKLGVPIGRVSNLWLPMLLASLAALRDGGAFALILPAECFTGVSAGSARSWLLRNSDELRCDLYPPGSYPDVLQEVVVVSGIKRATPDQSPHDLTVAVHSAQYSAVDFSDNEARLVRHQVASNGESWTKLLLSKRQVSAYEEVLSLPSTTQLATVAKFEVAAVTGANAYFSLRRSEVERFSLEPWARPLLARSNQVPGLHFTEADFRRNAEDDRLSYLFDSSLHPIDRAVDSGVDEYLSSGEDLEIPLRYKCRIRNPWYQVPYIRHSSLMLSKRCHSFPRAIFNDTRAVTTDTIYRGTLRSGRQPQDFVAGFHNSLTLLSAELEGRSFGGGVLELVPSEVSRLRLFDAPGIGSELPRLDKIVRAERNAEEASDALIWETDLLILKHADGLSNETMENLRDAFETLRQRRLDRNR